MINEFGKNPELSCWYSPADFQRFTKLKFVQSKFETKIGTVSSKQWSILKGTEFPFSEHNYLNALEAVSYTHLTLPTTPYV